MIQWLVCLLGAHHWVPYRLFGQDVGNVRVCARSACTAIQSRDSTGVWSGR